MTDYKQILIAFLATIIVIAGLASFVAYKNGELTRLTDAEKYAEVDVPLAPKVAEENAAPENSEVVTPTATTPTTDSAQKSTTNTNAETSMPAQNPIVTLSTSKGDIEIELFADTMPVTTANFEKLVKEGFYDGTKFHRVINGFMIQGGDPNTKGDDVVSYGRGGPGYAIKDEFAPGLSNVRGTIAMANSGPNTGGSQFFINLVPNTYLDPKHPVFGKVVGGMDVVDAISLVPRDNRDVPNEPVVVKKVVVK
jgi:peptidylprolyl isomerase